MEVSCTGKPTILAQSFANHYPDPGWDIPSVTMVNGEKGAPDGLRLLELRPQSLDRSDGVSTGDSINDAL